MTVTKVGDLVWVRVQGHPWWPGQVMDPKKTTNEKVKKDRKPDHTLISFFGDDSYGWFPKGRDIIPFDKNYDAKSKQPAAKKDKKFNRACAEGREVHNRRLGKDPVTKHRPHDFLHPGWSDDSDDEAEEDRYDDLRPLPASADKLQDCSAEQALLWLQCVACNPTERPKMSPVKIDGAKRQLFSLLKEQNVKLLEAAQKKKKKGRSPPAESSDAADIAAQPLEADAAHAGTDPEEEAELVAADSQKKKRLQGKKEKSAPPHEGSGSVGQAIKRKRKDDIEAKLEKPKKQRRKPAIAEVKDEEDQDVPTAVPNGSGALAEQVLPEVNAHHSGDEPVSDSDQEPEADHEAEAAVAVKKKRSFVRSTSYHGPGPRRLKAALPDVVTMLHNMAVDPTSDAWSSTTAEAAAWLSFRELIFCYSSFNRAEGEIGGCTAAALAAKGAQWVKVKAPKVKAPSKQYGVPSQPGPDLGIEYRYIHYVSKLPDSRQAFEEQLAQFYAKHGAILTAPSILQIPLDCYTVFIAVAERGGYEGVSGTRQWSVVAREWRAEMGSMEAARVKKAYLKLLLAFEQHLSQDCKVEVRKKKGARAKRAGLSGSLEPEDQPAKASKKRKAPSDAPGAEPAGASTTAAQASRARVQEEEESEPEGSEVSYDSNEAPEHDQSDADSDDDNDRRLAKAANDGMLRKLHKEAQRESKAARKKLQRQLEQDGGSTKQKPLREARSWASDEEEFKETLPRTDSGQGGSGAKGRRQLVDSRALAAKPGRQDEQDAKARAEARARQRAAMQARQDPTKGSGKSEAWRSGLEEMLGSPAPASRPQHRPSHPADPKGDAKTIVVLHFREDYTLPSQAIVFNVMQHYGSLSMHTDIWYARKKFLVYVQFHHEQDALTAQSVLERRASALFNLPEGSVQRVSLTVPYSKAKETSNIALANLPNPRAGLMAAASQAPAATTAAVAAPRSSSHMAPARKTANPALNLTTNTSQGFPSGLPQPTDPRRAAAAKSANPAVATQIGQNPIGRTGIAPAPASGSGQYPMAASGLGAGGGSGQFGAALPADPRHDPRKAARSAPAFRPASGFPGAPASPPGHYRPPPPPSQGGLPPSGGLPPAGGRPAFSGAFPPSLPQWVPPMGGLPPPGHLPGPQRPQGYAAHPSMPQRPLSLPSQLPPPSSAVPHQHPRPFPPAAQASPTPIPESSAIRANGFQRPVRPAALLPSSPPAQRPVPSAQIHSPQHARSPNAQVKLPQKAPAPAAAEANAPGPAPIDILSILRNAGMANPLAHLSGAAASAEAAQAAASSQGVSQQAAGGTAAASQPSAVSGGGIGSGLTQAADAGPVLAGDEDANGAPDVGSNLMALLSQLAPAGQ